MTIKKISLNIDNFLDKFKFVKFVLAGSIASLFDLSVLFILTDKFHVWYLLSSTISFSVGFIISFFIQKFWTFKDKATTDFWKQISNYLIVMGVSLIVGVNFVYILVSKFHVYYLYTQIIIDGILAVARFFINKYIIFKGKQENEVQN